MTYFGTLKSSYEARIFRFSGPHRAMDIGNFNRPKNREDSSDFDDFLTESIATALAIIFKIFESPFCERAQNFYEKLAKNFETASCVVGLYVKTK